MEVFIWTVLLIPGPLYSIWRRTGKQPACPHCQLPMLVNSNSDAAYVARKKFDAELGILPPQKKPTAERESITFGNDQPAETPRNRKPVNPDEW